MKYKGRYIAIEVYRISFICIHLQEIKWIEKKLILITLRKVAKVVEYSKRFNNFETYSK